MAYIPIAIPLSIIKSSSTGNPIFIPSYTGGFINIGFASECDIYKSWGRYWIKFTINGNYRYYSESFNTEEEAKIELVNILKEINSTSK